MPQTSLLVAEFNHYFTKRRTDREKWQPRQAKTRPRCVWPSQSLRRHAGRPCEGAVGRPCSTQTLWLLPQNLTLPSRGGQPGQGGITSYNPPTPPDLRRAPSPAAPASLLELPSASRQNTFPVVLRAPLPCGLHFPCCLAPPRPSLLAGKGGGASFSQRPLLSRRSDSASREASGRRADSISRRAARELRVSRDQSTRRRRKGRAQPAGGGCLKWRLAAREGNGGAGGLSPLPAGEASLRTGTAGSGRGGRLGDGRGAAAGAVPVPRRPPTPPPHNAALFLPPRREGRPPLPAPIPPPSPRAAR